MSLEQLTLSDEQVQDIVASLITSGGGSDVVYDDANDTLTVSLSDSISVNTLEAGTIVDGSNVSHTGELADLADVSTIQLSSDVTVTDTKPGGLSDGDFLKNSNGTLTGSSVQTLYELVDTQSGTTPFQITISDGFDAYLIHIKIDAGVSNRTIEITQVNNNSINADYIEVSGTSVGASGSPPIATVGSNSICSDFLTLSQSSSGSAFGKLPLASPRGGTSNLAGLVDGTLHIDESPVDSFTINESFGANLNISVKIAGKNI